MSNGVLLGRRRGEDGLRREKSNLLERDFKDGFAPASFLIAI